MDNLQLDCIIASLNENIVDYNIIDLLVESVKNESEQFNAFYESIGVDEVLNEGIDFKGVIKKITDSIKKFITNIKDFFKKIKQKIISLVGIAKNFIAPDYLDDFCDEWDDDDLELVFEPDFFESNFIDESFIEESAQSGKAIAEMVYKISKPDCFADYNNYVNIDKLSNLIRKYIHADEFYKEENEKVVFDKCYSELMTSLAGMSTKNASKLYPNSIFNFFKESVEEDITHSYSNFKTDILEYYKLIDKKLESNLKVLQKLNALSTIIESNSIDLLHDIESIKPDEEKGVEQQIKNAKAAYKVSVDIFGVLTRIISMVARSIGHQETVLAYISKSVK